MKFISIFAATNFSKMPTPKISMKFFFYIPKLVYPSHISSVPEKIKKIMAQKLK